MKIWEISYILWVRYQDDHHVQDTLVTKLYSLQTLTLPALKQQKPLPTTTKRIIYKSYIRGQYTSAPFGH